MQRNNNFWFLLLVGLFVAYLWYSNRGSKLLNVPPPDDPWFQAEVVNQELPVLVKFGAQWCGPCRAMEPILEELSKTMGGRIKIVDVDVDKNSALASHYRISSIPRLLLLDRGKIIADRTGSDTLVGLERWVTSKIPK